ncbi:DUF5979 domain-containing protein [Demequina sp. SYSU T00192]|uniref:DUF5979 domain-containing protein n=1 Tax=Demequina litoralis TaxID=3051660 RepID=A0ABT8GA63_9MICO|nr:DUF5979 domain-containing protein [Demequina sp. SYSU T00192]MDN4476015.1 DUF5979 domain-containing protein [Demequina sp. SYSU T00192]
MILLASLGIVAGATVAAAEPAAQLSITKTASETEVVPGQTFDFNINIQCTTFAQGCTNAQLNDALPAGLTPINVSVTSNSGFTSSIDGQNVNVTFTDPISDPADSIGMAAGNTAEIIITVVVDDLPYSEDGVPLTNEALVDATNPDSTCVPATPNAVPPCADTATVIPNVPLDLTTDITKAFDAPTSALAEPGADASFSLTATNTSDEGVTEMVVQDPANPAAAGGTFDYFTLSSLDYGPPYPPDADQAELELYIDGAWVPVTEIPADTSNVGGFRVTYSSSTGGLIQPGSSVTIDAGLEQRDNGAVDTAIPVTNTATSEVSRDDETGTDSDDDTYTLLPNVPSVEAGKTITPDSAPHGSDFNAELTGENTWTENLEHLTLTEPADGTPGFDDSMSFEGFADPFVWPAGATSATIVYECAGTDAAAQDIPVGGSPPPPPAGCEVTRFTIDFVGDMPPGDSATVNVTLGTDPDDPNELTQHDDTVGVEGTSPSDVTGTDEADDDFSTFLALLDATQGKNLIPGTIFGNAGEWIVATLPGGTTTAPTEVPFPDDATTVGAGQIVVQDPPATSATDDTPVLPSEFWDAFDPTEIASVAVLADSTLTVNYWDGDSWETLAGPITGPTTWSYTGPWPDDIGGLQFVYDSTSESGFPPGTTVQPNIVFELAEDYFGDEPLVIENCATAGATSDLTDPALSDEGCDEVEILPIDPDSGGNGNGGTEEYVEKDIIQQVVAARTGDIIQAELLWGTGGVSGVDSMTISDIPDPAGTPIAESFYEAFDLVSIDPITTATDPLMQWDQVAAVELYREGQGWVDATNDPCPDACDGTFPGYTLTAAEQADTIGVRLVFVEGSARLTTTDPTAPPAGSGVARTFDESRPITLNFQIRDDRRSDGSPVTGHDSYNEGDPVEGEALIRDDAGATAVIDDETYTDEDSDVIAIVDVPLNVGLDKQWTGGPLGDPPAGTAPEDYPSGRVTLTADNLTQARIDHLVLEDPSSAGTSPFDFFNLTGFVSMQVPDGTESWTMTLDVDSNGDGVADTTTVISSTPGDPDDATPLTSIPRADLLNVVGLSIDYEGRIEPDAQAVLVFDLQLRATNRTTGEDIEAPLEPDVLTIPNGATATVDDAGRDPEVQPDPPTVDDTATIDITGLDLGLTVEKQFGPLDGSDWTQDGFSQTEPDQSQFGMLLTAHPSGSARIGMMQIRDTDETFWNAYEFVGFGDFSFDDPIDQVQIDVLTGGTFTEVDGEVVVTGADWVDGEPGPVPALPAGVDPEDVQGIRITYTREDGTQWENSEAPNQQIPIIVQRRDELLTGGEVPTDMAGNDPAPGETEPGRSTNTIDGIVSSYLEDASGNPLLTVQSEDDTASVLYEHATTAVSVEKDPTGTIPPGSTTDFVLTITNTGDWPIIDPVITDRLPTDEDGPMLEFALGDDDPYSYGLTGAAPDPATGLPMPTDPADVTATVSGDGSEIEFTFPPGTVLEVGQTYTITITLFPRPGVAAEVPMTNSFGIVGERPFDECDGTFDEETGECQADTTVELGIAGALRSGKLVKADDDLLGVEPADCEPYLEDFYGPNCTPITAPGDTETWRMLLQNTGTVPLDRVVAIDLLPTVGDTGAINTTDRGSQWDPLLVDALVAYGGPAATVEVYGTTDDPICTDDLTPATPCPDGAWVPIDDIADLSTVTALQYDIVFDEPLQPGEYITLDMQTQTPALSETPGADTVAYNSVATGGVTTSGGELLPTEGNRVGVILATGPLEVLKEVTGDGVEFAPDEVTVTVVCTSVGETVYDETFTVPVGEVVTIDDLPYGSECTISEEGAGETSSVITEGTVGREDDAVVGRVTIENTYDLAGLEVTKAVESDAVDADGNPIEFGPFDIEVRCTFLGDEVWGTGYDADNPMDATLSDGESFAVDGLPAGAECTVTETGTAGASSITVTTTAGDDDPVENDGDAGTIILAPDGEGDGNTALVTNTFDVGDLRLTKLVTGPGADLVGAGPFLFDVVCTLPQPEGDIVTWEGEISLTYPTFSSETITDIAAGSTCTVTETDSAGADTVEVDPGEIVIEPGATVDVTATNGFDTGNLVITKAVTGPGAGYAPDEFVVTVTCTADGGTVFEETYTLDGGNGYTVEIVDEIPYGAECVVTEEDAGQTTMTTVPGEAVIGEDGAIDVTNDYQLAGLEVTKLVESDAVDADGNPIEYGPFDVEVRCTFLGEEVWGDGYDVDNPMDATLSDGDTFAVDGLPAGAECTVTETETSGAASVTVTVTAGDGEPEVIDGSEGDLVLEPDDNTALVTNAYEVGSLTLTKIVDGPGADLVGWGPFVFDVVCTLPQAGGDLVTWDGQVELAYPDATVLTIDDIAAGSECVITETDAAGADEVEVTPDTVTIGADESVDVTATNSFLTGDLAIRKRITGPGHDYAPDAFDVTVVCTVDGETVFEESFTLGPGNGYSVIIQDEIPYGAECIVTEEDAGQTSSTIVPGEAVVGVDDEVFVTNDYQLASLEVTKIVESDALDSDGDMPDYGPFTMGVECTFLGEEVWGDGYGPGQPMIGQVSGGETWTIDGLPAGAECTVTELDGAGAVDTLVVSTMGDISSVTYGTGGWVELVPDGENSVTFTNTFEAGELVIEKTVAGPGADELGSGPFVFSVVCTLDQPGGALVTWDDEVSLGGGDPLTATLDTIASGSECVVTETDSGGADDVLVLPDRSDPDSATVTVEAGATVTVTARNWFAAPPTTGVISSTGFGSWWPLGLAGLLVAAGAVLLVVRRGRG